MKKWFGSVGALGVLLFLIIRLGKREERGLYHATTDDCQNEDKDQGQASVVPHEARKRPNKHKRYADNQRQRWWQTTIGALTALFAGLAALGAFLAWSAANTQAIESTRQADAAEYGNSAYLLWTQETPAENAPGLISFRNGQEVSSGGKAPDQLCTGFSLENVGQTPAFNVRHQSHMMFVNYPSRAGDTPLPGPTLGEVDAVSKSDTIVPHKIIHAVYCTPAKMTQDTWGNYNWGDPEAETRTNGLAFWGAVTYCDAFNRLHYLRYCSVWFGSERQGVLCKTGNESGYYSDQRCLADHGSPMTNAISVP